MSDTNFKNGFRTIEYRYELLDRNFNVVDDISDRVGDCTIDHNSFIPVNRTAKFDLKEYTGEVPPTYKGDYQIQKWKASNPNKEWSSIDCWINDNFISFPKYKYYSGTDHEFTTGEKSLDSRNSISSSGWSVVPNGEELNDLDVMYDYVVGGGMLGSLFNSQVIARRTNTAGLYALLRTQTVIPIANKRLYFSGYFKSSDYVKPDVYLYYTGGPNNPQLVKANEANITTINVSLSGNNNDWKWFEGYIDMTINNSYTGASFAIGSASKSWGKITFDQFYYDAERTIPYRFRTDAALELDVSIPDALSMANSYYAGISDFTKTIEKGTDAPTLKIPYTALEIRFSFNGGSTWTMWSNNLSQVTQGQDFRTVKCQLRFSCESYTQSFKPKLKFWSLKLGAETNLVNTNKDKVDFAKHRIKPYLRIRQGSGIVSEHPLGVFLMSSPKRKDNDSGVFTEVDAYDQLTILHQAKLQYPITIYPERDNPNAPTGSIGGWAKTVKDILIREYPTLGYHPYAFIAGQDWLPEWVNIPNDIYNLPSKSRGRNFKMGETWLSALNSLLNAAGYTPLFCNSNGVLTSIPFVPFQQRPVDHYFRDDEMSIIFTEASEEMDTFEIANTFVAYQPVGTEGVELIARYTNNNQGHPSSVATQGRYITDYREVDSMESQAEIDRYIYRIAYEASQVYGQINFATALNPGHSESDTVYLRYQDLGIDGTFTETAWSMSLTDDPHMTHRLRRIASI